MLEIFGALSVILTICLVLFACDKYWWSFFVYACTIGAALSSPQLASLREGTPLWELGLGYLGVGLVVAALKWVQFTFSVASRVRDHRAKFDTKYTPLEQEQKVQEQPVDSIDGLNLAKARTVTRTHTVAEIKRHRREAFLNYVVDSDRTYPRDQVWKDITYGRATPKVHPNDINKEDFFVTLFAARARDYVERITNWIFSWPIVILSTVFNDMLLKLGKHAARLFDLVTTQFSRRLVSGAVKDM